MTQRDAIEKLKNLDQSDPEVAHKKADEILLQFLRAQGHASLADAFDKVYKWYA